MIDLLRHHVIPAALSLLPQEMDSPEARALLLAIAWQESRCCHRRQINGPARGYWQFEVTGVRGVLEHHTTWDAAATALGRLDYSGSPTLVHGAIEHNDILAAAFARLLLWTLPDPLPRADEPNVAWAQYLSAWRPGKPHRESWDEAFNAGWQV